MLSYSLKLNLIFICFRIYSFANRSFFAWEKIYIIQVQHYYRDFNVGRCMVSFHMLCRRAKNARMNVSEARNISSLYLNA